MKSLTNAWGGLRDAYVNRYQPEGVRVLAHFYWYTLICVTALFITVAISYGLWQLVGITSNGEASSAQVSVSGGAVPVLDREKLEATVKSFEERRTRYELLKENPPRIADPSR